MIVAFRLPLHVILEKKICNLVTFKDDIDITCQPGLTRNIIGLPLFLTQLVRKLISVLPGWPVEKSSVFWWLSPLEKSSIICHPGPACDRSGYGSRPRSGPVQTSRVYTQLLMCFLKWLFPFYQLLSLIQILCLSST